MIADMVNADFSRRVVVDTASLPWVPSPQQGVERRFLDRIGGEVAWATSLVRYAKGSVFPAHQHGLGEEFLVLEGVFSDEHGDYPVGTYVRNPPGSSHRPSTAEGCVILVKLRQMRPDEQQRVVVQSAVAKLDGNGARLSLHESPTEAVALERLAPGMRLDGTRCPGGEEILVLSGTLADEHGAYPAGTWIRNPHGHVRTLRSEFGATYWVKRGHLGAA